MGVERGVVAVRAVPRAVAEVSRGAMFVVFVRFTMFLVGAVVAVARWVTFCCVVERSRSVCNGVTSKVREYDAVGVVFCNLDSEDIVF